MKLIKSSTHPVGFPGGSNGKESACSAGDLGSSTELGRSPGEGNGNPLQYSCLENPMNREAWWVTVHGVAKSWTRLKWLSTHARHEVTLSLFKNSKQTVLIPFFNNPNYTHLYKIIYIILNYIYIYTHNHIHTHNNIYVKVFVLFYGLWLCTVPSLHYPILF